MAKIILKWLKDSTSLEKAIAISIVIGFAIAAVLVIETKEERFSSLYIYPDSYSNIPEGNTTSFIFGVKSYENVRTGYDLQTFISDRLMESKHFELDPGEVHEEKMNLVIPPIEFPAKLKLVLTSPYNIYDAHYWLKSPEEYHAPINTVTSTPEFTPAPVLTSQVPNQTSTPEFTPAPVLTSQVPNQTSLPAISNITLIKIDRNFGPKSVDIGIGGKIVWFNNDVFERKMTLVSKEGLFTKEIGIDSRFEYTFEKSGTYTFYLKEIPSVEGDVIVH